MRLFLSSYQIGTAPEKLTEIVGSNKHVALIMNAADVYGDERRPFYREKFRAEFAALGMIMEELDLRDYLNSSAKLEERLKSYGLIWASGGNTFTLRWSMQKSGFDRLLPDLLQKDILAYGGFSAGACVLSPTLRGTDLVDDPQKVPPHELQWEGLGLVDFCIAPHYRSEHPESAAMENVIEYWQRNAIKYHALHDGEALRIVGSKLEKVGKPTRNIN